MLLYFNIDNGAISLGLNDNAHIAYSLPVVGGQALPVKLVFHATGTIILVAAGSAILFGIKPAAHFEGSYLASVTDFTAPGDTTGFYTATLNLDTTPIREALNDDEDDGTDDIPTIPKTNCEIYYWPPGADRPVRSQTFSLTIGNWVNQGGEEEPGSTVTYPAASFLQRCIDALTPLAGPSGGAGYLDGVVTAGTLAPGAVQLARKTDGSLGVWILYAGTDATVANSIQRPLDYNPSTNAVVWKLEL